MKAAFTSLIVVVIITISTVVGSGCANIIPPSGGPKDSIPPQLIIAVPADSSLNFRGSRIILNFDEYIRLEDVQNNLLFTPSFEVNPEIAEKGKTITVRFRDSLSANTTYILNFGNAIRDVNESNILRNFIYTFSTGPALDSLEIRGQVLLAQTGKIDTTLIVVLHKNLTDSAVRNNRPTYVSRLDGNGNFRFRNLPAGRFAIYAIGDAGLGRRYQTNNQLFAFSDTTVLAGATGEITLLAYRENVQSTSTGIPGLRPPPATDRRLQVSTNRTGNHDLQSDFILTFNTPLRGLDTSKISLSVDSVFTKIPYTVLLDSTKKEIRLRTAWREGSKYNLILDRDFAEDTSGRKLLKTDTLYITTKKKSDYGNLLVRVRNMETAKNPVLQFLQNDQVVFSASVKSGSFTQPLFTPGEYSLRILFDANNNGIWDAGKFFGVKIQPEVAKPIERKITIKPNFDNEFDITL